MSVRRVVCVAVCFAVAAVDGITEKKITLASKASASASQVKNEAPLALRGCEISDTQDGVVVQLPNLPSGAQSLCMCGIRAGTFEMGTRFDQRPFYDSSEEPVHLVRIAYDFYLTECEVTVGQYAAFLRSKDDFSRLSASSSESPIKVEDGDYQLSGNLFGQSWNQPMVEVSWFDAKAFALWASGVCERTLRLPSEAEWEYACRAGSPTVFHFGNSNCYEWFCDTCNLSDYDWWCGNNTPYGTKEVGQKLPNAFGLFDMHGNAWEWCEDDWHKGYDSPERPDDGNPWANTPRKNEKVFRGGYWCDCAWQCRSARRRHCPADFRDAGLGFRLVMEVE